MSIPGAFGGLPISQQHLLVCRVCLTDEELSVLAQRGTAIAHCPLSNFYFADVLLQVQKCRSLGVKVTPRLPSRFKGHLYVVEDQRLEQCQQPVDHTHVQYSPWRECCCTRCPAYLLRHVLLPLQVGLGTDVAGGYSYSMLDSIRQAVIASKAMRMQKIAQAGGVPPSDVDSHLVNWKQAFWLATMGGAEALGIQASSLFNAFRSSYVEPVPQLSFA